MLFRTSPAAPAQVVLHSKKSLLSIDPRTGQTNWEIEQPCGEIPSTTVAGNLLVSPLHALTALRPIGTSGTPELLWSEARLQPDTPTPVAYEGRVYVLKGSVLSCADLLTGKIAWQMRLELPKAPMRRRWPATGICIWSTNTVCCTPCGLAAAKASW